MRAIELVLFCIIPTLVFLLIAFSLRREIEDNWRGMLFIAVGCVLFFHRIIFFNEALSQEDANLLQMQFFTVFRDAIRTYGEIPFWNPWQGAGLPNLAHPLSALFYPFVPVFLVGNVFEAMNVFVVLHFFLAGSLALLLGRRIFDTRPAAILFAVLYAFNGWVITRAAHQPAIEYVFAYAWLPLVALAFERVVAGESLLACIAAGGAGLAWMGIACPNVFVYAALILIVALALRMISLIVAGRRNAALVGAAMVVGSLIFAFALGAVEYLPARELSAYSTQGRLGMRLPSDWRGKPLSLWTALRLYFPLVGSRPFAVYYSPGVLALLAAVYGVVKAVRAKVHKDLALGSLVVLVIGLALVTTSPFYSALAALWDLFARASLIPAGLMLLFLPVVVLAAIGLDAAIAGKPPRVTRLGYAGALLVFLELFIGLGVIYPRLGDRRLTFDYEKEVADFPHLSYIASQDDPGRILVESPEGEVLAPSYATLPYHLSRLNLHASAFAPDALQRTVEAVTADPSPVPLEALGVGWIVSTAQLPNYNWGVAIPWPEVVSHYENSIYFPMHNLPGWLAWDRDVMLYRVSDAPTLVRAEALTMLSAMTGQPTMPLEDLERHDISHFQTWKAVPVAVVTPNTLTVVLPEVAPTRFFFAVTAYPGWQLYADGQEAPCAVAAKAFMAGDVPEGTKVVELRFQPTHWLLSLALAVAALVFAAASVGGQLRFTHRTAQV